MKIKICIASIFMHMFFLGYTQIGIGTESPNSSAILDMASENKGILIPRVYLKNRADEITINGGNVKGLLVYNLTEIPKEMYKGYYYWNGTIWSSLGQSLTYISNDTIANTITYIGENNVPVILKFSSIHNQNLTSLKLDSASGVFRYIDEYGKPSDLSINSVIFNHQSITHLTLDGNSGMLRYIDEHGVGNDFSIAQVVDNTESITHLKFSKDLGAIIYTDENNTSNTVFIDSLSKPWYGVDDDISATQNTEDMYVLSKWVGIGTKVGNRYSHEALTVHGSISQTGMGESVFFGNKAGENDDLNFNRNVAIGREVLTKNLDGSDNTVIGTKAMYNFTGSSRNTAIGFALIYSNSGSDNTVIGDWTLGSNKSSTTQNTVVGHTAMLNHLSGEDNCAFGGGSLGSLVNGGNNIGIGFSANTRNSPNGSNEIRMGNTNITSASIRVGWTISSDIRWKKNVRVLPYGLDFVMQLRPVDYIRINNNNGKREIGFIAQDLDTLVHKFEYNNQGFLTKDDSGYFHVRYIEFIPVLTKAIQEEQAIIISLSHELDETQTSLEDQMNETRTSLEDQMEDMRTTLAIEIEEIRVSLARKTEK